MFSQNPQALAEAVWSFIASQGRIDLS